jgi:hypothetical protein
MLMIKKIAAWRELLLFAALGFALIAAGSFAYLYYRAEHGDLNNDGTTNLVDFSQLAKYYRRGQ